MIKGLKKVISSIAALALTTTSIAVPALAKDFSDVASTASYYQAVQELSNLGIINGYEDGTFLPDNTVTRAEFAVMVCGALGQTDAAASLTTSAPFDDVPSGHWAAGYVSVAVNAGIISGYGDGTFGPDDEVTYEQIMKMLVCALNQSENAEYAGGYPSGYISVASQVGINSGLSISDSTAAATRKDVAVMVDNALRSYDYQKPNGYILGIAQYTDDDYDTLLSENHDTYIVQGRITATRDSEPGTLDVGEVKFQVEYSKNFDGTSYPRGNWGSWIMLSGDSGAEKYLDSYGEALIQVTDDDDYVIISFVESGKNTSVTFAADDFADDYKSYNGYEDADLAQYIVDSGKIYVYKEGSTSSVNTYTLASDNDVTLYVNGVNMATSSNSSLFVEYLEDYFVNNNVGEVTLIDTPQSGSTSADGKYDIIRVTYAETARVTSISIRSDEARIYGTGEFSKLTIPLDDDDVEYSVTIDGEEATIEDIQTDDVIAVYMDYVNDSFYNIEVTRGTVTGTVTRTRTLSDGTTAYTVNGTEYTVIGNVDIDTTSGAEYELWVDCFNRIVDAEEGSTTNTYAILQNVYTSSDGETVNVTLIKTDGTTKTYALNTNKVTEAEARALCFANGTSGTKLDIEDRVVEYKLNSSSEIRSLEAADDTKTASGEYSASASKVGSVRISDSTAILDVTEAVDDRDGYSTSDITAVSSLSDGTEYTVLGVGRSSNTSTYQFVLILSGESDFTADTVVAVFDSYGSGYYNDESVYYISAYIDGSDDLETLYVEEGTSEVVNMTRGNAFVYKTNSDGIIEDGDLYILGYDSLFDNLNIVSGLSNTSTLKYLVAATKEFTNSGLDYGDSDNYGMFILSGVDSYDKDYTNSDDQVRFVFAPVVDVSTSSITLGRVQQDTTNGVYYTTEDDQVVYTTTGANAYVYDYSYSRDYRLDVYSVGSLPSVSFTAQGQIKSSSPDGGIYVGGVQNKFGLDEDGDYDNDYINTIIWNSDDQLENTNYVFAKVVDDDITDIVYFAAD